MKKPIIGITLDSEKPGSYSKFDWYAIRKNYLQCIDQCHFLTLKKFANEKQIEI